MSKWIGQGAYSRALKRAVRKNSEHWRKHGCGDMKQILNAECRREYYTARKGANRGKR